MALVEIATFNDIFAPLLRHRLSTHYLYVTCAGEIGISAAQIRQGDMLAGRGQLFHLRQSSEFSEYRDSETYTYVRHDYDQVILRPKMGSDDHSSLQGYAVIGTTYVGCLIPTPEQELDEDPQMSQHQHVNGVCCRESVHADMDNEALWKIQDDWRESHVF